MKVSGIAFFEVEDLQRIGKEQEQLLIGVRFLQRFYNDLVDEKSNGAFNDIVRNAGIMVVNIELGNAVQRRPFGIQYFQIHHGQRLEQRSFVLRPFASHAVDHVRLQPEMLRVHFNDQAGIGVIGGMKDDPARLVKHE